MPNDEAWELIEEPAAHSTQEPVRHYHSWRVGDVLDWDEPDAPATTQDERRLMLRIIVCPN